jgi:tRNA dimethylallyltransferase
VGALGQAVAISYCEADSNSAKKPYTSSLMRTPPAILIAGPTASGKSALALELADKIGGIIINADSMQVYRDLRVITARPTLEEEARAPHQLYGHVDATENYSVGRWCVDAQAAIADAEQAGKVPIVVGGTGLYFKALTRGLAAVPPIPGDLRAGVRERLEAEGVGPLYAELQRRDAGAAQRLKPGDRSRIARALEVVLATGRPLSDWQRAGRPPIIDAAKAIKFFLATDRAELYRRINMRFDSMLASGALDEVEKLAVRGLNPLLPAMKAHGVPWLIRHLRGEIGLDEAAEASKRDTRRYTKRQATWFRHQLPDWESRGPDEARAAVDAGLNC